MLQAQISPEEVKRLDAQWEEVALRSDMPATMDDIQEVLLLALSCNGHSFLPPGLADMSWGVTCLGLNLAAAFIICPYNNLFKWDASVLGSHKPNLQEIGAMHPCPQLKCGCLSAGDSGS